MFHYRRSGLRKLRKMWFSQARFFFILSACGNINDDYASSSLRNGIPYVEQDCENHLSSVSVISPENAKPYCVRYQVLTAKTDSPIGVALIPGDLIAFVARYSDGVIVGVNYAAMPATSDADLRARLLNNIIIREQDIGSVFYIARPGTLGSSGRHADETGTLNEVLVLDLALDEIKRQYGVVRWVLVGQSGGAAISAMLMTRRDDLAGVVLASGSLDKKRLHVLRGHHLHTWNASRYYDPIDHVAEIRPYLSKRIIVIGDTDDLLVPFEIQRRYIKALDAAGIQGLLVNRDSKGNLNHRLLPEAYSFVAEHLRKTCSGPDVLSPRCFITEP